jgi:hypothetical protein
MKHNEWMRLHADEPVSVRMVDLMTLVARLRQVQIENDCLTLVHERIWTCDLPRLKAYLPEQALEIIENVQPEVSHET